MNSHGQVRTTSITLFRFVVGSVRVKDPLLRFLQDVTVPTHKHFPGASCRQPVKELSPPVLLLDIALSALLQCNSERTGGATAKELLSESQVEVRFGCCPLLSANRSE